MNSWLVWAAIGLLAALALLPLAAQLVRPARVRGRREADLALYRAQMAELDRESEAGRLDADALRSARLEVQRRLLAAPEETMPGAARASRWVLAGLLLAAPAGALGLYWAQGIPDMPSAPHSQRAEQAAREDQLLATLRSRVGALPVGSEQAKEGWMLLGNAERSRGRLDAAADAYRRALLSGFDPELVSQLAQVLIEDGQTDAAAQLLAGALQRAPQHVGLRFLAGLAEARAGRTENARSAWRALIADAPPDAPWRVMVDRQLQRLQ